MKTITTSLLSLCLAASLFISCKKDKEKPKPEPQQEPVKNLPDINDFTPTGTFKDTVTITGTYFSTKIESIEVKFGDAKAEVLSSTTSKIIVRVPENVKNSQSEITVAVGGLVVASNSQFILKKPEITKMPEFAKLDSVTTFAVKNFHPNSGQNKVLVNGNQVATAEFLPGLVKLKIPKGSYPDNIATIDFKMLDYRIEKKIPIKRDIWKLLPSLLPLNNGIINSFVIDNTAYLLTRDFEGTIIYKFNSSDFSWQKLEKPFRRSGVVTATSTHAYLFYGNTLVEYNPNTNEWVLKKEAPFSIEEPAIFSVGNSLYVGLGDDTHSGSSNYDFYRYDIDKDTWNQVSSYPAQDEEFKRMHPTAFVINDIAYVAKEADYRTRKDFFTYNYLTDTWIGIQDSPTAFQAADSFTWNGKGYVAGADNNASPDFPNYIYQYSPAADKWIEHSSPGGPYIYIEFLFVVDGKAFAGLYNGNDDQFKLYAADLNDF